MKHSVYSRCGSFYVNQPMEVICVKEAGSMRVYFSHSDILHDEAGPMRVYFNHSDMLHDEAGWPVDSEK